MTTSNTFSAEALAIARVVARDDRTDDWEVLRRTAALDPGTWERLGQALHDDSRLRSALADVVAIADAVALPEPARRRTWPRQWLAAGAALVVVAVTAGALWLRPWTAPVSGERFVQQEELPRLVLEARPLPDGRATEVVYLRRIVERAAVEGVVEVGFDEYGEPRPRLVEAASLVQPRRF